MENFIARQPIFDKNNNVIAYELLFRNGYNNSFCGIDGDYATQSVINNAFINFDLSTVVNNKKAFINFTENLLNSDLTLLLPSDCVVIEILENIEPSPNFINTCKKLKEHGFILALDDFVYDPKYKSLLQLCDIIKIDFSIVKGVARKTVLDLLSDFKNITFLAEKVETYADFKEALDYGYSYFQGYFFSKPKILTNTSIITNNTTALKLLSAISEANINYSNLEKIILLDVGLSYKLLKFINSAHFGFKKNITNIKHAITLLGEKEAVKWIYLIIIADISHKDNPELNSLSLLRAKFCENLCLNSSFKEDSQFAYITGLFSVIDGILNMDMNSILNNIPLNSDIIDALTYKNNNPLSYILNLAISYERGNWNEAMTYANLLSIPHNSILQSYSSALLWSTNILRNI